ncbi:reverse transcriptase domain-containing protein [Tanacetum coccineum]
MSWEDFKTLTREELCPVNEMQKLETEFWNHAMVGAGHTAYTDRFHELARLVPHLVTPENKRIERYIYGLAPQIRRMVEATEPATIQKAVQKSCTLTDEAIRNGSLKKNTEKREKHIVSCHARLWFLPYIDESFHRLDVGVHLTRAIETFASDQ